MKTEALREISGKEERVHCKGDKETRRRRRRRKGCRKEGREGGRKE